MRQLRARIAVALAVIGATIVGALALVLVVIPFALGAQGYTVLTGSMSPTLEPGHFVVARSTPISDIRIGDVVTYQLRSGEPTLVTHRVVATGIDGSGERVLHTQGDANSIVDAEPVRAVQVRGVALYAVPWIGYLNAWATPLTRSVVTTTVGAIAIGWGVYMLFRSGKRAVPAAAALVVALTAAFPVASTPAAAATAPRDEGSLGVSADGENWSPSHATISAHHSALVPGDEFETSFWVRNASRDPAIVTVTAEWESANDTAASSAFANALTTSTIEPQALGAGDVRQLSITTQFPTTADNRSRTGTAAIALTVRLTQDTSAPSEPGALPGTGASLPLGILLAGAALVAVGLASRRRADQQGRPAKRDGYAQRTPPLSY